MSQITTHILDTALGKPAARVPVTLFWQRGDNWREIGAGRTDGQGRVADLCAPQQVLEAGTYRLHFDTAAYFSALGAPAFYPWVDLAFTIGGDGQHYHIPLLLSPFGYSSYRGS